MCVVLKLVIDVDGVVVGKICLLCLLLFDYVMSTEELLSYLCVSCVVGVWWLSVVVDS